MNFCNQLLEMVRLVRDCQASETLPVLVHCSAGCGRTGSICVIDYVWGLLKTGKLSPDISLYALVQEMRRQRIAMVQTVDQYMLCHCSVRELFLEQLRVIDVQYENVGNDGRPLVGDTTAPASSTRPSTTEAARARRLQVFFIICQKIIFQYSSQVFKNT